MHPSQPTGHFRRWIEELQVVATLKLIRASWSAAVLWGLGLELLRMGRLVLANRVRFRIG